MPPSASAGPGSLQRPTTGPVPESPCFANRHQRLAVIACAAVALLHFLSVTPFVHPVDSLQDFAFALGYPLSELITRYYNDYLYGLAPLITAGVLGKILAPLSAMFLLQTLLSTAFAVLVYWYVITYIRIRGKYALYMALVLILLFLKPQSPIFGWKLPYSISVTIGVVASMAYFASAAGFLEHRRRRFFCGMFLFGLISVSSKLEFAAATILFLPIWILLLRGGESADGRRALRYMVILFASFVLAAYVNYCKLLPPWMRVGDWSTSILAYQVFIKEVFGRGGSGSGFSAHFLTILAGSGSLPERFSDVAFQGGFFVALRWLPDILGSAGARKACRVALYGALALYLGTILMLDPAGLFSNIFLLTMVIGALYLRRRSEVLQIAPLAAYCLLYSFRVALNIQPGFFSIFYGVPFFILFFSVVSRIPNARPVLRIYTLVLTVVCLMGLYDQYRPEKHNPFCNTTMKSSRGETFRVCRELQETILAIQQCAPVATIGSAKNIPALNAFFNAPNPHKELVNVEFYLFTSNFWRADYLNRLARTPPDVFVYSEPLMMYYIASHKHQNLSIEEFRTTNHLIRNSLAEIYDRKTIINRSACSECREDSLAIIVYHSPFKGTTDVISGGKSDRKLTFPPPKPYFKVPNGSVAQSVRAVES